MTAAGWGGVAISELYAAGRAWCWVLRCLGGARTGDGPWELCSPRPPLTTSAVQSPPRQKYQSQASAGGNWRGRQLLVVIRERLTLRSAWPGPFVRDSAFPFGYARRSLMSQGWGQQLQRPARARRQRSKPARGKSWPRGSAIQKFGVEGKKGPRPQTLAYMPTRQGA